MLMLQKYSKIFIIFGSFLILILGWILYDHFSENSYQKVDFSETLYPKEIALYRHQLDSKWGALTNQYPAGVDIGLDKIDLNDDGIKDVIVYTVGTLYGGSHGYKTEIFITDKTGHWYYGERNIWNILTFGQMVVLRSKHNGYRDIVFLGGDSDNFNRQMLHYCYWNGISYDVDHSIPFRNQFGGFK